MYIYIYIHIYTYPIWIHEDISVWYSRSLAFTAGPRRRQAGACDGGIAAITAAVGAAGLGGGCGLQKGFRGRPTMAELGVLQGFIWIYMILYDFMICGELWNLRVVNSNLGFRTCRIYMHLLDKNAITGLYQVASLIANICKYHLLGDQEGDDTPNLHDHSGRAKQVLNWPCLLMVDFPDIIHLFWDGVPIINHTDLGVDAVLIDGQHASGTSWVWLSHWEMSVDKYGSMVVSVSNESYNVWYLLFTHVYIYIYIWY